MAKIASTKPELQSTADHHIAISQPVQAILFEFIIESTMYTPIDYRIWEEMVELSCFLVIPHDFEAEE